MEPEPYRIVVCIWRWLDLADRQGDAEVTTKDKSIIIVLEGVSALILAWFLVEVIQEQGSESFKSFRFWLLVLGLTLFTLIIGGVLIARSGSGEDSGKDAG